MILKVYALEPKDYPKAYQFIVKTMQDRGLSELGNADYRAENSRRFMSKAGEIRAASMDMDKTSRVLRTLVLIHMTSEQLKTIHNKEKSSGNFIINIKSLLKLDYEPVIITDATIEAVTTFNDENRPEPRKFEGVSIPPYFPLDNEFDGMEYHHDWDFNIHLSKDSLFLPVHETKRKRKFF